MARDPANGIYPYKPSQIATLIATGLFGISAIYHSYQMIRKKSWFYIALVIGAYMMTIGYAARYISAKSPMELTPFIVQTLCILLPPSLYAATIYMIYGRIAIFVSAPSASIIRPTWVTKIFVIGDIFAFLVQAGGGAMTVQEGNEDLGQKIMLVGLFVQLLFFAFFLVVAGIFYTRMRHHPARYTIPKYGSRSWLSLLKLLFVTAAIIILRCVFRIIEFAQGHDGYLIAHEVFLYVFDAAPMLLVQLSFHVIHAGDVFPRGVGVGMEKLQGEGVSQEEIGLRERV